jgi:protein ImuB
MGVGLGMDLANARALVRGASLVAPHRPEHDLTVLRALAAWCTRFAPTVGVWPCEGTGTPQPTATHGHALEHVYGLVLDITGTERLYRSESHLVGVLQRAMTRRGLRCRIAAASCIGCACAVARCGRPINASLLVPPGHERTWLDPLPLEAILAPSQAFSHAIETLHQLGLTSIGELTRLPRASLPSRFGPTLLRALDLAYGRSAETIEPIRPKPPLRLERIFEGPTTQWEAVQRCTHDLVESLTNLLRQADRGVRRLDVTMTRANRVPPVSCSITLCLATRNVEHLWSMLRPHLERLDMGDGVEAITVNASRTGGLRHEQISLANTPRESRGGLSLVRTTSNLEQAVGMLVDTLSSRLGAEAVMRAQLRSTHVPEHSQRWTSLTHAWQGLRPLTNRRTLFTKHEAAEDSASLEPPGPRSPRPSRLFLHPERIEVMHLSPDGPLHRVSWRREAWVVKTSIGPERIGGRWWLTSPNSPQGMRDYYRVHLESKGHSPRWLWIYRDGATQTWHVHGEWA